jgi:hypothetical protein
MVVRVGLGVLMSALVVCGCSHYLARGSDLYYQGRYIDAAHVFQNSEERLASAPQEERAEYALYRGCTLLRLGDLAGAERWLGYAQATEGSLDASERHLLRDNLAAFHLEVGRRVEAGSLRRDVPVLGASPGAAASRRSFAD